MEAVLTVISKVAVMLILIVVGYLVTKKGMLTERGASEITTLLIQIVTPCLIVNSFLTSEDSLSAGELLLSVGTSALAIALSIGLSLLFFRKEPEGRKKVLRFAVSFSNAGFMGLPLLHCGVQYLLLDLRLQHDERRPEDELEGAAVQPRHHRPAVWPAHLLFGFASARGHRRAGGLLRGLEHAPGHADYRQLCGQGGFAILRLGFCGVQDGGPAYKMAALRLLVAPALFVVCLLFIRPSQELFVTSVIQAACPVAANTVLFSVQYKRDSALASKTVAVSTVLSIISIPLMTILAQGLCNILY